ncbi:MAG TPA: chemotaxis response regulator protein-glutamate methylesterase [Pseudomonas sp.]|nr:chemotaxis response regulator protein-glutamate methylesterase [Pseudomonas sp.]
MPIKVLVVDDSALIRALLREIIDADPELSCVGCAPDAYVARDMVKQLRPEVITLDIEMPRMDGLAFLEKLMAARPTPVVMISSLTEAGAEATFRAMELGAVDFVAKTTLGIREGMQAYAETICQKIKVARHARIGRIRPVPGQVQGTPSHSPLRSPLLSTEKLIAIGASTGGTEAIRQVLQGLPANSPGIVITQHMPAGFTRSFAERLDRLCAVRVSEAQGGERILPGHAFIAPGGYHLLVERSGANYLVRLDQGPAEHGHRPAVDPMFRSLAQCAGRNVIAALLTGMGKDGASGLLQLRQAGAFTLAQNEASCVVYGMPREAVALDAAEEIRPLDDIAATLLLQARQRGSGNRV